MIMKFLIYVCMLIALSIGTKTSYKGDKVFHLTPQKHEQLLELQALTDDLELDLWKEARFIGDNVDVRVPIIHQNQFNVFLATSGIENKVKINDVQSLIDEQTKVHLVARNLESFQYDVYHTFDEINGWIDDITGAYPNLITKHTVGRTYENREFYALQVGISDDNPKFVINCGIHAREWIAPATCLYSVNELVSKYSIDSSLTSLMNAVTFVFIPSSNPDGYAYTWSDDRMWRKTRKLIPISDCVGIDPNRNWASGFGGNGSSEEPCSDIYRGEYPFSENCTAAQRDFVEGLGNVHMYMDVHAYGQLWMHSYGYTGDDAVNADVMNEIAKNSVVEVLKVNGISYQYGSIYSTIYPASGITCDYFYDMAGVPCTFTAELRDEGEYGFLLPEDQIIETGEEVFAGFKVMAQAVADNKCASKTRLKY